MAEEHIRRIGVLTSGGDAPGMNAAVRAVVRAAISKGAEAYAILEGYQGLIEGGDYIRRMEWGSVGGILQRGGTVIGTARSSEFRTREGRLKAARNLLLHGIDGLVIIGGDGSLTGANTFRQEWPDLLADLVASGEVQAEQVARHGELRIVGMVGSIDNDFNGTDMTIGADTALHRITEAIDAITSTAASHQRTFVIEVMGRHCGYLALMSGIAGGADWVFIPERPPTSDDWESELCETLQNGRQEGRRDSIVIVAEGAKDRYGKPIEAAYVRQVLEERMGEDTRVTILGHVQRGGAPSAFDRWMSTLLGFDAVAELLDPAATSEPKVIGIRQNRVVRVPLMECVEQTRAVAAAIAVHDYDLSMKLRGSSFCESFQILNMLVQPRPQSLTPNERPLRFAVVHGGGPAPGMNTAVRSATRLVLDRGHVMLGVHHGFQGLMDGDLTEMNWMSVSGWATMGGTELGTRRRIPADGELYPIARTLEHLKIDGLLVIGGWSSYQAAYRIFSQHHIFPAFNIPIICMPASINNNLPGSELSIGADTALNNIIQAVDKIKQSAVASRRCFVVEVMGRECGYLTLMSGIATGSEQVYLPEEGVTLRQLQSDLDHMRTAFAEGKRLALVIRNEDVNPIYTTPFIAALFEEEGGDLFEVRKAVLGHLQQGGDPSPFDRILATRLGVRCAEELMTRAEQRDPAGLFIGHKNGSLVFYDLNDVWRMMEPGHDRPRDQWWLNLRPLGRLVTEPPPSSSSV